MTAKHFSQNQELDEDLQSPDPILCTIHNLPSIEKKVNQQRAVDRKKNRHTWYWANSMIISPKATWK